MKRAFLFLLGALSLSFTACHPDDNTNNEPKVKFKFRFDPQQARLNNLGLPATMPAGHAAQSPSFRLLGVHYIEFAQNALTMLGAGSVLYHAPETTAGGANAIDFNQEVLAPADSVFLEIPISQINPGTYTWVRASVGYQNYDIRFNVKNIPVIGNLDNQSGTISSFLGFNTYIQDYRIRSQSITVNDDRTQGYWGFEPNLTAPYNSYYSQTSSGQAPAGATTVVNPIANTSPIPAGSCVVTGQFTQPLVITGTETSDITVTLSFSTNQSFEWIDSNGNGQLDFYADGSAAEAIVDMGVRGLEVQTQ